MKYLLLLILAVLCAPAYATTINCVPPTKNADGSAFDAGAMITFNVYSGPNANSLTKITPTPLTSCQDVIQIAPAPGTCYAVSAVETTSAGSAESALTGTACIPPTPSSPTIAIATTSTIAYMLIAGKDTYGVLIVGSVPLGTTCDATKPLLTYFVVPTSSVTFTGNIKSPVVVANCQ